jgi:hypothetical protein
MLTRNNASAHFRRDATFRGRAHGGWDCKKGGAPFRRTLAMFKLPACDPFAITVLGFGVLLAAILTFAF